MEENWLALFLWIVSEEKFGIRESLIKMGIDIEKKGGKQKNPRKSKYSQEFIDEVSRLRYEGKSYKKIGKIMGITQNQVYGIIKMYGIKK